MKRILLTVILASIFVGSMPAMEVTKKIIDSIAEVNKKTNYIIPSLIGSYALKYSMMYAHELGHALTNKLLFGNACSNTIYILPYLLGAFNNFQVSTNLPLASIKKRIGISDLVGPLVGLTANVLALKLHNIFIEWRRNNTDTSLQVCLKGLQKPLFNSDQSLWILIPVILDMSANIKSLINIEDNSTDISRALENLQINNPKNSYPEIAKFTHYFTLLGPWAALGLAVGFKILKQRLIYNRQ
jgi:hypothetical protein